MKKYLLSIEPALLKDVKVLVANKDTTIAQLIRDLLEKEVQAYKQIN